MENDIQVDLHNYLLLSYIGSGGQAEVRKVKDKRTGVIYAAKINYIPLTAESDDELLNLKRELEITSEVNHPAIVKFIGFSPIDFHNDDKPVIISEYMANGSLKGLIEADKKEPEKHLLNETRKLIILYGIASAMAFLHSHSILHRDLKPANILMDESYFPKIADFGLAKDQDRMSMQSTIGFKGTLIYSSPEIYNDHEYLPAGDVYAFGMIVYELISGNEPYYDLSYNEVQKKIEKCEKPSFTDSINDTFRELMDNCWISDPNGRPTFDQIVEVLKNDEDFITDDVDVEEYHKYIEYIDGYKSSFNQKQTINLIDSFLKRFASEQNQDDETKQETLETDTEETNDEVENNDNNEMSAKDLYSLGIKYQKGMKVAIDKQKAASYFKKAAEKGDANAMNEYGLMLINGDGIDADTKEAVKYFQMASNKGNINAMYNYGHYYKNGTIDHDEFIEYFDTVIESGNVDIMDVYALNILGTDDKKAAQLFKKLADQGDTIGLFFYAYLLQIGSGIEKNKKEAAKYYKIGADKGHIYSMINYALMLEMGDGIDVDKKEAARYLKTAADMGDAKAMNNYAAMLEEGQGVDADMNEAAKYYKMAAEKGEKTAIINYAYMLKKGKIDNSDTQEVMKYYKMAAECGEKEFCPSEIVKYYKMSADYGDVSSMEMYAKLMDDNEDGDTKEAAKYYKMAADHGNVESMIIYATKAYNGEGIDVDKSEAATYYKMAADLNDSTGILNYARMLSNGDGIPADKEEAEKYYKLLEDDSESESSNEEIIKDFENTDKSDDENQNDLDHFAFSLYNKQSSFKKGSNDRQPLSLLFVGNNDSDNTKLFSAIYNSQLQKVNKQKDDCMFTINCLENGIQGMVSYTDLKTKEKTLQMIDSWDPFNIIVIVFSMINKSSLEDAYYKWYLQFPCYRLEKKVFYLVGIDLEKWKQNSDNKDYVQKNDIDFYANKMINAKVVQCSTVTGENIGCKISS